MFTVPFTDLTPTKKTWVSPNGSNANDGSYAHPYKTIQFALDHATPGTAVMVKAGIYAENVEFHHSGTAGKPIWLISADGKGAAHVNPGKGTTTATIEAFGEDYIVISGFDVSGGDRNTNGICVTPSGTDFSNLTHHVVIKNNIVHDTLEDGIKISQGDNIYVVDNTVSHAGDQGIDFVAVNNSVIARNDVTYVTGPAAIFAKGGSTHVLIADNHIAHAKVDGIVVGGWSNDKSKFRPGFTGWEAKDVIVIDNYVEDVGKRPLNILGGQDSKIVHNYLESNPDYYCVVNIGPDNLSPPINSKNILLQDNVLDRSDHWLNVSPGQGSGLKLVGNHFDGDWSGDHGGPGGETFPYALPWQADTSAADTLSAESTQDAADSGDQSPAAAKTAAAAQKPAASNPAGLDDVAEQPSAGNSSGSATPDAGVERSTPQVQRHGAVTRLAAHDLFSDLDDGQAISGIDSAPHPAAPPAAPATASHDVAAVAIDSFRGSHEAADVAAVEQQLQQG